MEMGQGNDLDGIRQRPADVHALWLLVRVEPAGCTGGLHRDVRSTQSLSKVRPEQGRELPIAADVDGKGGVCYGKIRTFFCDTVARH